ncbi:MAG: linear amide C-N hydrolase [Candidatus Eisenbacteria bacterium]
MRVLATVALCCLLLTCSRGGPANACTSFVMDTPDGPLFGTNCDLFIPGDGLVLVNRRGVVKETYQTNTNGERAKWTSEYGSVTFSLAGREFVWGGMNEAGLVLSSMQLTTTEYPEPDERPALLDGTWGQYILDTCDSIEEVIRTDSVVTVRDQGPGSHYLVSDADGNCVAVEYLDGQLVYYAGDDLPVKAMSNMRYGRALAAYERGGTRWWWSNPGQSAERFAACQARAESFDAGRDTSAVNYAFGTLVYHVAAPHTRWNIVFNVAERELWFRSDQSPTYKHISMDSFDFSCDAPKLMLDVNAQLEGDVESHFAPYDRVVNREIFSTFCARWGIKVSEEGTDELMRHFETFECTQ